MSAQQDYWSECISIAAEECGLNLTLGQLECIAKSVECAHDNYGMAFYSPSANDRVIDIEREWKARLKAQQEDHARYVANAEEAIKRALKVDGSVSIEPYGRVLHYAGRITEIQ